MLKQATSLAAASLVAVFMTGCASMPNLYEGGKKDNVCKPGDTYQECCEKRELKKPLKYRFGGACERNGGDNDRGSHSTPDRGGDTPDTDTPDTDTPDSEGPSDQDRGNTGHDHSNDGDKGGDKGGQDNEGQSDQGRSNDEGGKNDSRDGGPGMGEGGRGDVGGRDHSALKIVRPVFV